MALIAQQDGRLLVQGGVTVDTVTALLAEGQSYLVRDVVVDFAEVVDVDSSAISLLFEWQRLAQANRAAIAYANLPPTLISLASLYGVLDLIPQPAAAH